MVAAFRGGIFYGDMVTLVRTETSEEGTFGILAFRGHHIHTLEPPWNGGNNKPNTSCIPPGKYKVRLYNSPRYKRCYHVTGTHPRTHILFHHGNFARTGVGRTNSAGCILTGTRRGRLFGQKAVLGSRIARTHFETVMGFEDFELEIINGFA